MAWTKAMVMGLLALALAAWSCTASVRADEAADGHAAAEHAENGSHAEGEHGGGHHEVNTDPLEFKKDLAIWNAVVFLVLLAVLSKFAWGPIVKGLDQREEKIAHHIAETERHHADAKKLLGEYEKKLAAAQDQVRAMLDEARRDAEHTQREILAKANADAQAAKDRALREVEVAKDSAIKELADRSTNLAVELAGKIVQAQLKAGDHSRLIQEAVARFPQSKAGAN